MEKSAKESKPKYQFGIKEIKEQSSFIAKKMSFDKINGLAIEFHIVTNIDVENSEIKITSEITYKNNKTKRRLFFISVINTFLVKDLKSFTKKIDDENEKDLYDIPDTLLLTLIRLSLSHVRGIMVPKTTGTNLEKFFLPIIPNEVILKTKKIVMK
jgi:hypothetical protein